MIKAFIESSKKGQKCEKCKEIVNHAFWKRHQAECSKKEIKSKSEHSLVNIDDDDEEITIVYESEHSVVISPSTTTGSLDEDKSNNDVEIVTVDEVTVSESNV